MKIAVVGTGAMGSVYAALLKNSGNEVWAIDLWQDHLDAINATGLRVEGASGDRTVTDIKTATSAAYADPCDLYIIATKASGVAPAAQEIAKVMPDNALVLTIQNGLGSGERISAAMPTDRVLLGVAEGFGASMKGPGHAHHNAMKLIRIGEMNGGMTDRLKVIEKVWQDAGFDVQAFDDIEQLIWEKFICNVTFSAPCVAFDCTVGELMAKPDAWDVALGCTDEAFACGKAKGVNFSFDDARAYATEFGARMPGARPSMLLDHMSNRKSEIDAINGMVPKLGRELGIPTPFSDTLTAIVRAKEARFDTRT